MALKALAQRAPTAAPKVAILLEETARILQLELAGLLIENGALEEALYVLRAAPVEPARGNERLRTGELWLRLARAQRRSGRTDDAERALRQSAACGFVPGISA